MVTYKLSSQFAPRARGLPFVQQHRRVPGSAAAASVRLSLSGRTVLDGTGKLSLSGRTALDGTGKLSLSGRTILDETGKLSLSGPSDADKTGEEMLPRCRNGDDCHQRRPKLRLTGRDGPARQSRSGGPPGLYQMIVTGGSACPVSPAVVWFACQQPSTAGARIDLSASAGPARLCHSGGPDNVGRDIANANAGPDNVGIAIPANVDRNVGYPWRDNVGNKLRGSNGMGKVRPFHHIFYWLNADRSVEVKW